MWFHNHLCVFLSCGTVDSCNFEWRQNPFAKNFVVVVELELKPWNGSQTFSTRGVKSLALAKLQTQSDTTSQQPPCGHWKTSYLLSMVKRACDHLRIWELWFHSIPRASNSHFWPHFFRNVKMEFLSKVLFCYFLLHSAWQRIYVGLWLKMQLKVIILSRCWADCGQGWSSLPMTMNGDLGSSKAWLP